MNWEEAWESSKYEVGRAMHEGWKRQKIANGFADHPYEPALLSAGLRLGRCTFMNCELRPEMHHPDMIDWDDFPPHQQAINYEGGREGFRMGYEAGYDAGWGDGETDD